MTWSYPSARTVHCTAETASVRKEGVPSAPRGKLQVTVFLIVTFQRLKYGTDSAKLN
jgi:hypothetical protein